MTNATTKARAVLQPDKLTALAKTDTASSGQSVQGLLSSASRVTSPRRAKTVTRDNGSTALSAIADRSRIVGAPIAPLLPGSGKVRVLIVGEAPGPRGADKSGIPFFGDAAGKHLYLALRKLGAVVLPDSVDETTWDGALLRAAGIRPIANQISLTNAFDRCPTNDGRKFRAPTRAELELEPNTTRLRGEIDALRTRGLTGIVTLGKVATRTMLRVVGELYADAIAVHSLPHPSAQGLLAMAPNHGRGARMADLQSAWMEQCMSAIRAAGFDLSTAKGN